MANKKKIKIDGKEYDLSEFDDTRSWSRNKNKKITPKGNMRNLPNILGRV
jgi:hypothetical protein